MRKNRGGNNMRPNKSCPGAFKPTGRNVPTSGGAKTAKRKKPMG